MKSWNTGTLYHYELMLIREKTGSVLRIKFSSIDNEQEFDYIVDDLIAQFPGFTMGALSIC